jgi:SAM-dependent methyltransferase
MTASGAYPEEPLAISAPLAREIAPQRCHVDPSSGENCAWYHGFWQYLRLFDFITTPRDHAEFYRAALGPAIEAGQRGVLISGTADYALLHCLRWVFEAHAASPVVTVLDLCETPLRLNEWYAARHGLAVRAIKSDILAFTQASPFDMICTHSFLGRFRPADRPKLVARWHELLRPGGRVVTVNRIRPEAPERVGFTAEQATGLRERVLAAARGAQDRIDVSPDAIATMADAYAGAKQKTHPVRSISELEDLFSEAGFRLEQVVVAPVGPRSEQAPLGPTMSGGAHYAQIVAIRD